MGANPADVVVDKTLISEVKDMIRELVWNAKPSPTSTMIIKKGMKKPNLNKILEVAKAHPDSWRVVEVNKDNLKGVKKTLGFNIARLGDTVAYFKPAMNLSRKGDAITSNVQVSPNKIKLLVHKDTKKNGRFLIG